MCNCQAPTSIRPLEVPLSIISMEGVLTWILHAVVCADLNNRLSFHSILAKRQTNKSIVALHLTTAELVSLLLALTNYNCFLHTSAPGIPAIGLVQL